MTKQNNKPLKIEGNACGKRIVDSLYKAGELYYFVDTGWTEPISHPIHCIGKMTAASKDGDELEFTDEYNREFFISPIDKNDMVGDKPMLQKYNDWKKYLEEKYPGADPVSFVRKDMELGDIEIERIN